MAAPTALGATVVPQVASEPPALSAAVVRIPAAALAPIPVAALVPIQEEAVGLEAAEPAVVGDSIEVRPTQVPTKVSATCAAPMLVARKANAAE